MAGDVFSPGFYNHFVWWKVLPHEAAKEIWNNDRPLFYQLAARVLGSRREWASITPQYMAWLRSTNFLAAYDLTKALCIALCDEYEREYHRCNGVAQ